MRLEGELNGRRWCEASWDSSGQGSQNDGEKGGDIKKTSQREAFLIQPDDYSPSKIFLRRAEASSTSIASQAAYSCANRPKACSKPGVQSRIAPPYPLVYANHAPPRPLFPCRLSQALCIRRSTLTDVYALLFVWSSFRIDFFSQKWYDKYRKLVEEGARPQSVSVNQVTRH